MAKLNKEQLKKLYDYGGTLSPKDWANMIDNIPENPIYNKKSLPIVKTTYEEVRELYNSGKMDPNVKYQFDYKYDDLYYNQRAYFQDLIIYLDGGTVKAEYTGVTMPNGDPITIDRVDVYNKSFKADFIFDSIVTSDTFNIVDIYMMSEFYEEVRSKYVINITELFGLRPNSEERLAESLKDKAIPHKFITEDDNLYVELYDIAVLSEDEYPTYIYDNYIMQINDISESFTIRPIPNLTTLAAIVNVQYDDGIFHKVFIDRYGADNADNHYCECTDLLQSISFYNGDLDTTFEVIYEPGDSMLRGISFTDIEPIIYAIMDGIYIDGELVIEMGYSLYCHIEI